MPRHRQPGIRESESERLRQLRLHLGLSQRDLAAEFRVAPAAVAQWESGSRTMPGPAVRLLELHEEQLQPAATAAVDGQSVLPLGWVPRTGQAAALGLTWHVLRRVFARDD